MKVNFDNVLDKAKLIRDIKESLFSTYTHTNWSDEVHFSYKKYLSNIDSFFMLVTKSCNYLKQIQLDLSRIYPSESFRNDIKRQDEIIKSV